MYYILRTYSDINKHWGMSTVGVTATKKEAKTKIREMLNEEPTKANYIIVKAIRVFYINKWAFDEAKPIYSPPLEPPKIKKI